jgi:hypothetical protein
VIFYGDVNLIDLADNSDQLQAVVNMIMDLHTPLSRNTSYPDEQLLAA